jgi:uncharacterized membrane protein
MSETARLEPMVETPAISTDVPVTVIDLARPARTMPEAAPGDQLSRIEEKAARIEEKFARQEAVFGRAQDSLDRAAERVEMAARTVDAAELAQEVANLRARVAQTPRFGALLLTTLLTAVITTAFVIAALKFFPGLLK